MKNGWFHYLGSPFKKLDKAKDELAINYVCTVIKFLSI